MININNNALKHIINYQMTNLNATYEYIKNKNFHEHEFNQAVSEVLNDIIPYINNSEYDHHRKHAVIERLIEPERIIQFRVVWHDDKNRVQINRGFRVQMNSLLGPYKGGLRFSPKVNLSVLKFLAFEQSFKNSLTGLPLGAAKGGADFDPRGKSDFEIMRFCQSFMNEFYKYIGPDLDIPAGDMGVGSREVGFLFGQYKKLSSQFHGAFTGKSTLWGGSSLRQEATGYGLIYFLEQMLCSQDEDLKGKKIVISGCGNVAYYTALKAIEHHGNVLTLSNSTGYIYDKDGFDLEKLNYIGKLGRDIYKYSEKYSSAIFAENKKPWEVSCDIALPCATENEILKEDAKDLIENGCTYIAEGANMPCTIDAVRLIKQRRINYAPGKAANAGGVAVSGLEMAQNAGKSYWSKSKVDNKLRAIMENIYQICELHGNGDLAKGANIAGYLKLSRAMIEQGLI